MKGKGSVWEYLEARAWLGFLYSFTFTLGDAHIYDLLESVVDVFHLSCAAAYAGSQNMSGWLYVASGQSLHLKKKSSCQVQRFFFMNVLPSLCARFQCKLWKTGKSLIHCFYGLGERNISIMCTFYKRFVNCFWYSSKVFFFKGAKLKCNGAGWCKSVFHPFWEKKKAYTGVH